jgi:hypothetical protein
MHILKVIFRLLSNFSPDELEDKFEVKLNLIECGGLLDLDRRSCTFILRIMLFSYKAAVI